MGAPLVWLAVPSPADARAAEEWSASHGVFLAPPVPDNAAERPPLPVDETLTDAVEDLIERAAERLATLDFAGAEGALVTADGDLRAHPELPQAAWLRAEVERGWSRRWLQGGAEEAAGRAWQRGAELDGGRLSGIGERPFQSPPQVEGRLIEPASGARGAVRIDGIETAPGPFTQAAGEHQLIVTGAGGEPVYAAWFGFTGGALVLPGQGAAQALPCSARDLEAAREHDGAVRSAGIVCPLWLAARPARGAEAPRFALCHRESCGPLAPEGGERAALPAPPEGPAGSARGSGWVPWALAGAGVALAAGAVIVLAARAGGAPPAETHFVNGGLVTASRGFVFRGLPR